MHVTQFVYVYVCLCLSFSWHSERLYLPQTVRGESGKRGFERLCGTSRLWWCLLKQLRGIHAGAMTMGVSSHVEFMHVVSSRILNGCDMISSTLHTRKTHQIAKLAM